MTVLEVILMLFFAAFLVGTVAKIVGTLARKRNGDDIERARLVFFFLGCLMLVCMIPMRLFELLSIPVAAADLVVVGANFLGYALTYEWQRKTGTSTDAAPRTTVRAYQIYYRGKPYALIAKEGIEVLLAHKLLKRQHTVELIEDFQTQAQRQGVGVTLLRSKDGSKGMLMRVVAPPPRPQGADKPPV